VLLATFHFPIGLEVQRIALFEVLGFMEALESTVEIASVSQILNSARKGFVFFEITIFILILSITYT